MMRHEMMMMVVAMGAAVPSYSARCNIGQWREMMVGRRRQVMLRRHLMTWRTVASQVPHAIVRIVVRRWMRRMMWMWCVWRVHAMMRMMMRMMIPGTMMRRRRRWRRRSITVWRSSGMMMRMAMVGNGAMGKACAIIVSSPMVVRISPG